jgi:hypothetical protein
MTHLASQLSVLSGEIIPMTDRLPSTIAALMKVFKDTADLDGRIEYTVDIDRDLAELLLGNRDTQQRRISNSRVAEIRADIEAGKWLNTGDPIRLTQTGTLVDGQHRLTAYLTATVSGTFVLRDMRVVVLKDRAALDVVDTGKSRTVSDLRKMTGRRMVPAKAIGGVLYEIRDFDAKANISKLQRNEIVDNHPFLDEVVELAQPRRGVQMSSTPVIAAAVRCMRVSGQRELAFQFFNTVLQNRYDLNGVIVPQLKLLSDWLINNHHSGGGHAIRRETVARCIHAWNAYRENRDIKHIRYFKSGEVPKPV